MNAVYTSCQNSRVLFINGLIFDIMNTQNTRLNQSLEFEWTPVLAQSFSWFCNVFLKLFQDWLNSVQKGQGNFERDADQKVFISRRQQTYEGLKISINSIIETTQFLLWHQVKYILTERFCQDPLENWFGMQRSLGLRKDNPSMADFRYNNANQTIQTNR